MSPFRTSKLGIRSACFWNSSHRCVISPAGFMTACPHTSRLTTWCKRAFWVSWKRFTNIDPSKNVELKTYAKHRIQGAILDSLRDLDWSPRPLRKKARQLEQAHQRLRAQFGRPATEPELALELGMELKELQHLLGDLRGLDLGSLQDEFTESGQERESLAAPAQGPDQEPYHAMSARGTPRTPVSRGG